MAEADLSKIVSMIMDNPQLIEQIKKMSTGVSEEENSSDTKDVSEATSESAVVDSHPTISTSPDGARRKELLRALKPYVSEQRSRAIDTMMSIADILDMMRER